jgi:hypothetical protein
MRRSENVNTRDVTRSLMQNLSRLTNDNAVLVSRCSD